MIRECGPVVASPDRTRTALPCLFTAPEQSAGRLEAIGAEGICFSATIWRLAESMVLGTEAGIPGRPSNAWLLQGPLLG
jgi:hypothetical protein